MITLLLTYSFKGSGKEQLWVTRHFVHTTMLRVNRLCLQRYMLEMKKKVFASIHFCKHAASILK